MKQIRCLTPSLGSPDRASFLGILFAGLFCFALSSPADIDNGITQTIWKMVYGVTDAQIASSTWLAADDDKDGISNGAEIAAGTDPFNANSTIKISSMVPTGGNVQISFPTILKKQYFIQSTADLGNPASWGFVAGANVVGDGGTKTLTVQQLSNTFYRVLVQDMDSDADGVSDWAEKIVGYDPTTTNTSASPTSDHQALVAALANSNVVTVTATKYSATQPPDAGTPPVETGSITVSRSGLLTFNTINVPLQKTGTAAEGTDYDALPASVTFGPRQSVIVLTVNPKANAALKTNVTAIVKALSGVGYTLGSSTSGSVVINPAGVANGTGLTGQYWNGSSSNYPTQQTIFAGSSALGAAKMIRTDATIDFANSIASIAIGNPCVVTTTRPHEISGTATVKISGVSGGTFSGNGTSINTTWTATSTGANTFTVPITCSALPSSLASSFLGGTNGWSTTAGPIGMSSPSANAAFSVRWTGQVLPQYSETYYFDFRSDDSAKVWVNGVLLVDRWTTQGATEYVNSIPLKAGVLYDIQIDYWNSSGDAEARLYWWSPSQTKQIIPQGRLFPAPAQAAKPTALTNSLTAVGYVGTPFSFGVTSTSTGGTTTYALAADSGPLPPGLNLNSATGVISGNPTTAGTYNVAVNATNVLAGSPTGSSVVSITIFPAGGVTREILAATGDKVSNIVIPSTTPAHDTIATIDDDDNYADNTGERLRGYIVPPKTGNYYFWVAANNAAELWISDDAEYVNKVRRASITASTGKKTWGTSSAQQTQWLSLVAGQKYYFEVLHNTGADADDYVAVGWLQEDVGTVPSTTPAPNANGTTFLIPNGGGPLQGYPLSGTVPGYLFQPYDYPPISTSTDALFSANLGPQGSSTTKASGAANLRVNSNGASAILHFYYTGLSTARTAYHLHVDAFDNHPQGEIIYDIDDIDSFHADQKAADGGYTWNFAPVGSFPTAASLLDAVQRGKVYLNVHTVNFPAGEIRGTLNLVDGSQTPPSPYTDPGATDVASDDANAARFLNQASFGANPADVAYVKANGFQAWIADQLAKPASRASNDVVAGLTSDINTPYPSTLFTDTWWKNSITGSDQLRQRLAFALSEIMVVSWANNTGPLQNNGRILADYYDKLVDYCLPTSGLTDSGTFRGVLKAVTLTPAMGLYLDMRGNQKGDDSIGRHPNENYAREIMQLFSVGLNRMWDDGRLVLDSNANLIPTYSQPSILGVAALLTGWNYAQPNQASGRLPTSFGPAADYLNPMVLVPTQHDLNAKLLLNNVVTPAATGRTPRVSISSITPGTPACTVNTSTVHGLRTDDTVLISNVTGGTFTTGGPINASFQVSVLTPTSFTVPVVCTSVSGISYTNAAVTGATVTPATFGTGGISAITGSQSDNAGTNLPHPYDQYGLKELDVVIDNIVNNDNVPPYICRQLIQRLVTSAPSPGYVYRVVQKFKDNGSGVRGDLAAVVTQILTDGEARRSASTQQSTAFGKQREPVMRLTGPARAFPAAGYTGTYTQLTGVDSNKLRIVTSGPNDFSSSFTVSLGFSGNYSPAGQSTSPYNVPTSTAYSVQKTLGIASIASSTGVAFNIASIATGNPCTVTTTAAHGLNNGDAVTITGVSGGTFSPTINNTSTTAFQVTVLTPTSFTVASNCTVIPTSVAGALVTTNQSLVTAVGAHGLTTGANVTISGVSGGTTIPSLNGTSLTFAVAVVDSTSFKIPVKCVTVPSAGNVASAQIVGGNTLDVLATGMSNVAYSQTAGSATMTVSTGGPATDIAVPGTATIIKSRVYLKFLTQTASGGAVIPADGIYDVQTANGATNFTVFTADTPTTARAGNVIVPKIATSYTPQTSNTIVQYNTNVNHNLNVGDPVWADIPVVNTPVADAQYVVTSIPDERHFKTSYLPSNLNGGSYSLPSGSNNGATIYPLVPPPLGRSGVVTVNQSTFNLGSTEGTLTQSPLNSPTVFNFFFPDYKFPGTISNAGVDSPEFQLTTDTNVVNLTNSLTNMFISTGGGNGNANGLSSFNGGGGAVVMSIAPYMTSALTVNAGIPGLVDQLANLLVGAPLETATRTTIINFVANTTNFPMTTPTPTNSQMRDRVRAIIHLIITSAEYAVQK